MQCTPHVSQSLDRGRLGRGAAVCLAVVLAWALGACGTEAEPSVPTSLPSSTGAIVRVPIRADGTLDTAGMPRMRFESATPDRDPLVHQFGAVDAGAIVEHTFRLRNVGGEPLVIQSATSTCGCTVPSYPRGEIAPGDTASVFVRFDTEGKAGPQDKIVTLTANTYPNQTTLHLVGEVDTLR